ncbi:MAG: DUF3466 family protein [Chromatiales bacterium]|jgi:uncharacterized membrane protein|nr:DUF3466 family protein [Chromatiales bacterium]
MSPRFSVAVPVALLVAVAFNPAAEAADPPPYRYTANYIGLLSPAGVPGGATGMRLTDSGSVFGYAPVLTGSLTVASYAAFEWKAGVITPQFTLAVTGSGTLVSPPRDVSSTGVFVGYDTTTNTAWARQGATEQVLPTLPNTAAGTQALQVNAAGTIVGVHFIQGPAGTIGEPIRWESGSSTATAMPMPTDFRTSSGVAFRDINETGVAVGLVNASPTLQRATVWDATTARFLPSLSTDFNGTPTRSDAVDVNELGALAGNSDLLANNGTSLGRRAVAWSADGVLTNLGTLSTRTDGIGSSDAVAINEDGDVIGSFTQYSPGNAILGGRGFIWEQATGQMRALGTLGAAANGTAQSAALGVNNQGLVVGSSTLYEQSGTIIRNRGARAVIADPGAGFVDLNPLVDPASLTLPNALQAVVLNSAFAVSDRGWILASSSTGCQFGNCLWLLTPYGEPLDPPVVPVPAAAWLLGSGLAVLLARTRRRRGAAEA